jgi:hypothetical protein
MDASPAPRRRRPLLPVAVGLSAAGLAEPPGPGLIRVLAPTEFPTWQTWNVANPFVLEEAGRLLLYYSGSGDTQMNDSVTDSGRSAWDYRPASSAAVSRGEVVDPGRGR